MRPRSRRVRAAARPLMTSLPQPPEMVLSRAVGQKGVVAEAAFDVLYVVRNDEIEDLEFVVHFHDLAEHVSRPRSGEQACGGVC